MVVIDTSSLSRLVQYYLPFDNDLILFNFFKKKIEKEEIIIIDKVWEECCYVSGKIIANTLPYLKEYAHKTESILPYPQFFHYAENDFWNPVARKKLSNEEKGIEKQKFLEGADAKLLLYCKQKSDLFGELRIVTEETEGSNDNKFFKKIPTLCRTLDLPIPITLPQLFKEYGLEIKFAGK